MPQECVTLKCYSCKMFQAHLMKKSKSWTCKLCNSKQSCQKIYLQGSGSDCRKYVQQANMFMGSLRETVQEMPRERQVAEKSSHQLCEQSSKDKFACKPSTVWSKFVPEPSHASSSSSDENEPISERHPAQKRRKTSDPKRVVRAAQNAPSRGHSTVAKTLHQRDQTSAVEGPRDCNQTAVRQSTRPFSQMPEVRKSPCAVETSSRTAVTKNSSKWSSYARSVSDKSSSDSD